MWGLGSEVLGLGSEVVGLGFEVLSLGFEVPRLAKCALQGDPMASQGPEGPLGPPRGPKGPLAPKEPEGPRGPWVRGGDPDLPVVTKHEPAGTRLFHARSRQIRVDGNNPQG